MNDVNMYPSAKELLKLHPTLPLALREDIADRYERFGIKYVTHEMHTDGRLINKCMTTNSAQDAIEEVIDAVFNLLVLDFKEYNVRSMMALAVTLYEQLLEMRAFVETKEGR